MSAIMVRRVVALAVLAAVAVGLAAILSSGGDSYTLYAKFRQAGGLRQGFKVRVDGAPVGKIKSLDLDSHDNVVAKLEIDKSAAPVGRNVSATARAADLLGEKFVDLSPGNRSDPAPSGTVIPPSRTGLAVELDDVINAVDLPTQQALKVFVNEQGTAYVGQGENLAALLSALPSSLDRTGELLKQFGSDNATLGRLVEESDRVVGSVARERASLGKLVSSASGTLTTLGNRSRELNATVRNAPGALQAARRALTALEGAAVPLRPAARGLRETAPALTSTLKQLPGFTKAAQPTLQTIRQVTPQLLKLGHQATPVVRQLQPLSTQLADFGDQFDPVSGTLDKGAADILGVLEGWARATQGHDGASHIFRFGLTAGPAAFADLLPLINAAAKQQRAADGKQGKPAAGKQPKLPLLDKAKPVVPKVVNSLPPLLSNVTNTLKNTVDKVTGALGLGDKSQAPKSENAGKNLLDYLLKP